MRVPGAAVGVVLTTRDATALYVREFAAAVTLAAGFLLFEFLTNSTEYYCNVDEVNVKSNCNAAHNLRVQGTVSKNTVRHDGQAQIVQGQVQ